MQREAQVWRKSLKEESTKKERGIQYWTLRYRTLRCQQRNLHSTLKSAREEDQNQVSAMLWKPERRVFPGDRVDDWAGWCKERRGTEDRKRPLALVSSCSLLATCSGVGRKSRGGGSVRGRGDGETTPRLYINTNIIFTHYSSASFFKPVKSDMLYLYKCITGLSSIQTD